MGMQSLEHELLQQVKNYGQQVFHNPIQCPFTICPRCHERDPSFKLHEVIPRIYQVIAENEVHKINSVIIRMRVIRGRTHATYSYIKKTVPWKPVFRA